jgi:hypothetical protein
LKGKEGTERDRKREVGRGRESILKGEEGRTTLREGTREYQKGSEVGEVSSLAHLRQVPEF